MHARITEDNELDPLDVFLDLGTLISEARIPGLGSHGRGYGEGPHCSLPLASAHPSAIHAPTPLIHVCSPDKLHCQRYQTLRKHAFLLWQNAVPLCIEVLVGPECSHGSRRSKQAELTSTPDPDFLLLERWTVSCATKKETEAGISSLCLIQAVRSFLHFSQLSAWLNKSRGTRPQQLLYRLTMPGQAFMSKFVQVPADHHFPAAFIGHRRTHHIKVSVSSLPRTDTVPRVTCSRCQDRVELNKRTISSRKIKGQRDDASEVDSSSMSQENGTSSRDLGDGLLDPPQTPLHSFRLRSRSRSDSPVPPDTGLGRIYPSVRGSRSPPARRPHLGRMGVVDDRMRIHCNRRGKHDCHGCSEQETRDLDGPVAPDELAKKDQAPAKTLAPATKRRGLQLKDHNQQHQFSQVVQSERVERRAHEAERRRTLERTRRHLEKLAEPNPTKSHSPPPTLGERGRSRRSRKDCFITEGIKQSEKVPSSSVGKESAQIANQVARETERKLTDQARKSEPASSASGRAVVPTNDDRLRFQKSLNSAASLVFHTTTGASGANAAPSTAPFAQRFPLKFLRSPPLRMTSSPLLGSFEECLLNGRLEPMSTVEGFRAELGASGSFCPSHELLPVSVFFYSFGGMESDKTGSPYLAHLNLGSKGYQVPRRGTVQLTLFNPQGTVVKMFVILFDLEEMPPNSKTFLRQRTYYMPAKLTDSSPQAAKWLRYLIHLRFCSSKTGRIYLHTDIRIIVLRKSDVDTASGHIASEGSYEWKSFTRGPSSPRFSTR